MNADNTCPECGMVKTSSTSASPCCKCCHSVKRQVWQASDVKMIQSLGFALLATQATGKYFQAFCWFMAAILMVLSSIFSFKQKADKSSRSHDSEMSGTFMDT